MSGAHHRGRFTARARAVRAEANADPLTRCWRCGRTLAQHPPHLTGRPAHWTAGHPDGWEGVEDAPLLPEASTCNYAAGGRLGNERKAARRRRRTSRRW